MLKKRIFYIFVAEKIGLISIDELESQLEPLDADNYGLTDEMQFWYDPVEDDEKPLASQEIKSLKNVAKTLLGSKKNFPILKLFTFLATVRCGMSARKLNENHAA